MKKIIVIAVIALLAIPVWIMADPDNDPGTTQSGPWCRKLQADGRAED